MKRGKGDKSNTPNYYHLRLFVAGEEPNSRKAKEEIKRLCEVYLKGTYKLEVVDVLEDYQSALENNILLAPTLVILSPPPQTKIVGSISDIRKVLDVLGLRKSKEG